MTLSGAATPGQSGPGIDGNGTILRIPPKLQSNWNLTIRLFSVMIRTFILGGGLFAEVQSVYSTVLDEWVTNFLCL